MTATAVVLAHGDSVAEAALTLGLPLVIFAGFMLVQRRRQRRQTGGPPLGDDGPDSRRPTDR